jgi:hypothetical protein
MANGSLAACDFCKTGHVAWRLEEMTYWQSSDRGYVRCHAEVSVGTCDKCGSKTLEPESVRIFDAAFQREYKKLL